MPGEPREQMTCKCLKRSARRDPFFGYHIYCEYIQGPGSTLGLFALSAQETPRSKTQYVRQPKLETDHRSDDYACPASSRAVGPAASDDL
jgi:hypothetical protein